MTDHEFTALYAHYPAVIAQMRPRFTSHEFILQLARHHQELYIEALYDYRHHERNNKPEPFLIVHTILEQRLNEYPELIEQTRKDAPSKTIFNQDETCAEWHKR